MELDFAAMMIDEPPPPPTQPDSAVRFRMPPTATYSYRWGWWDGPGKDSPGKDSPPLDGRLLLGQRRKRMSGQEVELYAVEESPNIREGRVFLLLKVSNGEVYETFVGHGGEWKCTCKGMQAGGHECKHIVAVRFVVDRPESQIVAARPEMSLC